MDHEGDGGEAAGAAAQERCDTLERALGYRFGDRALLEQALTHSSFRNESPGVHEDNERLEFLGDAVLELVISEALFVRFPDRSEGALTQLRARVVNSRRLSLVARRLGVGEALLLGRGEAGTGGRERRSVLADGLEAVLGALFLDRGFEAARGVVATLFAPELDALEAAPRKDAKTRLQEWAQQQRQTTPSYRIVESRGPDHAVSFAAEVLLGLEAVGAGQGPSKKEAHQRAAADALARLGVAPAAADAG